jgi:hypothetical protein
MTETLAALLLAHVVADFLLQPRAMVRRKAEPPVLLAHVVVVALVSWAALGFPWHGGVLVVALAHLAIDGFKIEVLGDRLGGYLGDQALHVLTLVAVALWQPGLYASGVWAMPPPSLGALLPQEALAVFPAAMACGAGAVAATLAGGHAVSRLLAPLLAAEPALTEGSLPDAGRMIGWLERGLAFFLILVGQPGGVGFLIAAKSVLRFSSARDDRRISEYVIVGTLASVGWALATAYATLGLVALLP